MRIFLALILMQVFVLTAQANDKPTHLKAPNGNLMDELDPFSSDIQQTLEKLDKEYLKQTGKLPFLETHLGLGPDCYRLACSVYVQVVKSEQKLYLYLNGHQENMWQVSTGRLGHSTPDFDVHPDGRIYDAYSSHNFPGGNYNGLGNMPYAVFIQDGFAIHGTTEGNWPKLGTAASHGCVRLHPTNGKIFNRLVRQYGVQDVWVTIL